MSFNFESRESQAKACDHFRSRESLGADRLKRGAEKHTVSTADTSAIKLNKIPNRGRITIIVAAEARRDALLGMSGT